MQELGNAINESLSDSDRIAAAIGEIKRAGYDVFLVLEATIGFNKRTEEDENEEVGRPEGPRDDSHVDPYAWGGSDLRTRPVIASTPPPPVAEEHESEEVLEEDDAEFAEPERPEVEMPEVEAPELPPVASRPAEPAPTSRPVGFGRRRSRR